MRLAILHSPYKFFLPRECDKYTVYILLTLLLTTFKGTPASGTTQRAMAGKKTHVPHSLTPPSRRPGNTLASFNPPQRAARMCQPETLNGPRKVASFRPKPSPTTLRDPGSWRCGVVKSRRGGPKAAAGKWRRPAGGVCPTDSNEDHTE